MNRTPDPESVFRALKPTALDGLADDGYSRRRDGDLSNITATVQGRQARRRPTVRFRLIAGVAAAACVAAGAIVVVTAGQGHRPSTALAPPVSATPAIDARTFLLASAQTAAKAPATTGDYWYTKTRTTQWTDEAVSLNNTKNPTKLKKPKTLHLSSLGTIASTEESWIGRVPRARTIVGIDTQVTMSPADKASLKAFGPSSLSPGVPSTPTVSNYNMQMHFQIGNKQVTMAVLAGLPTDPQKLEAELRRRYKIDRADPVEKAELKEIHVKPATFADVLWGTAQDLLAGPITPGTRAALYQVLAKQPGIKAVGTVTDALGRKGVALTMEGGDKGFVPRRGEAPMQERLIIDPDSAQLLAHESYSVGADGKVGHVVQSDAVQAMGWTDRIDQRP